MLAELFIIFFIGLPALGVGSFVVWEGLNELDDLAESQLAAEVHGDF